MPYPAAIVVPFQFVQRDAEGRRAFVEAGFRVSRAYLPGHDEMFETLLHPAVFRSYERAERFAERVNACGAAIDLKAWSFDGGACSPLGKNEVAPYSVL